VRASRESFAERVHRAMTKLNARDRAQLVVIAYQSGLVRPTPPQP
jgi:DNA-binding NarL/FixJ family response regulator